jgi:hypothetical protein
MSQEDQNDDLASAIGGFIDRLKSENADLRADNVRLAAALEKSEAYCRKMDGIIEEVGGVTVSCINPYDDLKRAITVLKAENARLREHNQSLVNVTNAQSKRAEKAERAVGDLLAALQCLLVPYHESVARYKGLPSGVYVQSFRFEEAQRVMLQAMEVVGEKQEEVSIARTKLEPLRAAAESHGV